VKKFNIETQYLEVLEFLKGQYEGTHSRDTRSGTVVSYFSESLTHYRQDGFPAFTTKKIFMNSVVGELLWFLSGKCDLPSLRTFSDIKEGGWTIWTNDYKDYLDRLKVINQISFTERNDYSLVKSKEWLGYLYGNQWRNFGGRNLHVSKEGIDTHGGTDQLKNLIEGLKSDPHSRRHIVTSYDPSIDSYSQALPPCHTMFQCYVDGDFKLSLKYSMRSNDWFLGCPFNVASYALLQRILCKLTGYGVGDLHADLGDVHLYEAHFEASDEQLSREPLPFCEIELPDFEDLDDLVSGKYTAKDFKLIDYKSHSAIKAPILTQKEGK